MYTQQDNMEMIITGTLYGSKLFDKDVMMGTWSINVEKALVWEHAMLERIEQKKPWVQRPTGEGIGGAAVAAQGAQETATAGADDDKLQVPVTSGMGMHYLNKTPVYQKLANSNNLKLEAASSCPIKGVKGDNQTL